MALIDVVDWNNNKGEIIYRFPEGAVSLGAQLVVREGQEAIFFKDGQALDTYGPGKHTLKTGNIPILEKLVNLPFGGKSPFPAEIYFISKTEIPDMKWGTKVPIQILDPEYQIPIPVRAFGSYSIRINDIRGFLMNAIGSWQAFTSDSVGSSLRDQIMLPEIKDLISEFMIKQNLSILKLSAYYDEIGVAAKAKLHEEFASFGIELVRFSVGSINVPDDDESVIRLKKILGDKAEMRIMGDDYNRKRTFDTMEKAAGNEGMAGATMGAGMGFGMGNQMSTMMNGTMTTQTGNSQQQQSGISCPHCNASNPDGSKFCSSCGKEMIVSINCPSCNASVPANAKFCPECGSNVQEKSCTNCGVKLAPGAKFCPDCGNKQ